MQNRHGNNKPIKYALFFSLITIILYYFGPYKFPDINKGKILLFLLVTNLFMYCGFAVGTKYRLTLGNKPNSYCEQKIYTFCGYNAGDIIKLLFWVSLIICIPKFILYTGAYSFGLSGVISRASMFFTSAQDIYVERQSLESVTGLWRYINYVVVLCGPLYWAYTPLAILCWKNLTSFKKVGSIFIWFLYLLQYLVTGTNVGFFDFFLTVLCVVLVKRYIEGKRNRRKSGNNIKNIVLFVLIIGLLLVIFNTIMGSRIGDQYLKGGSVGHLRYTFDSSSIIWRYMPNSLKVITAYLTRYVSNSYIAIAYALELPFKCTFGLGHSWFILDNLGSLSSELWARTYNMRIEDAFGYGHYANWHTVYLWFANDVSFIGVPILFFFLYYFYGRAWRRFLEEKDLFCFLRFIIFVKMSYFISANNQIFQNSDTLIAFWGLCILTFIGCRCSLEGLSDEI